MVFFEAVDDGGESGGGFGEVDFDEGVLFAFAFGDDFGFAGGFEWDFVNEEAIEGVVVFEVEPNIGREEHDGLVLFFLEFRF